MNRFFGKGTVLGVPYAFVAVIGVAVLVFFRKLRPLGSVGGALDSAGAFVSGVLDWVTPGASPTERAQNEKNKEAAQTMIAKSASHGQPTADDKLKADKLYNLMDGYFNQSKVADLMGTIATKYEMNRVYTAFGVRSIVHGGVTFFRTLVEGDLIAHFGAYDIDIYKTYKRKNGSGFTIYEILKQIGE